MDLNRRKFIKNGGLAITGSIFLPPLLKSCNNIQLNPDVKNFLLHFQLSRETLQKVISVALSKGGSYADLFFEHKISNNLGLEDRKVNRAYSNIDYGVGIRVLKGDQTGFAYSEIITPEAMTRAAKMAASIASQPQEKPPAEIRVKEPASSCHSSNVIFFPDITIP